LTDIPESDIIAVNTKKEGVPNEHMVDAEIGLDNLYDSYFWLRRRSHDDSCAN
jgi:hypothetical protein